MARDGHAALQGLGVVRSGAGADRECVVGIAALYYQKVCTCQLEIDSLLWKSLAIGASQNVERSS